MTPRKRVEATTRRLLREAAPGDRFIMGIMEDIPENRWQQNLLTISRMIHRDGELPIPI